MQGSPLPGWEAAGAGGGGGAAAVATHHTRTPDVDPGMHPQRFTHQHKQAHDFRLNVADIPGATPGHTDRLRPRSQPLNPLDPHYCYLLPPRQPEEPLPPPRFIRDAMDVSDIVGAQPHSPAAHPARALPSTMDASDIAGATPGWRPHILFNGQARDVMRVNDISTAKPAAKEKHWQLVSGACNGGPAAEQCGSSSTLQRLPSPYGASLAAPGSWPQGAAAPDYGVPCTADWQRQQQQEKMRQAEAARQGRQAADAAIAAVAAKAAAFKAHTPMPPSPGSSCGAGEASGSGQAGLLQNLKAYDRDRSGSVQAVEFVSVLQRSGLGLSQGEAQHLAARVQDSHNSVEYQTFVSKLWGKMQASTSTPATGDGSADPSDGAQGGSSSQSPQRLPQFIAARQRQLQTHVALLLGQQPEALAQEAADVAALASHQPWKLPTPKALGKRMQSCERPPEFVSCYNFCGGDPRSEQADPQWKLSKDPQAAWAAMRPREEPSKQHQPSVNTVIMNSIPLSRSSKASPEQQQQRQTRASPAIAAASLAGSDPTEVDRGQTAKGPLTGGKSAPVAAAFYGCTTRPTANYMRGDSPLLAAERAARAAAQSDVDLVRSLQ